MCGRANYGYGYNKGYGYNGGYGYNVGYGNRRPFRHSILGFLEKLSPGTCIVIQFDCQPPVTATFHDIFPCEDTISVSGLDGFDNCSGLTYIAIDKINAVSVLSNCPKPC